MFTGSRRVAGVHRQHRARDVPAALTQEVLDHRSDIAGLGQTAQRAAAGDAPAAVIVQGPGQFGVDEAGRDRVYGDAEPADFTGKRTGEADGCGLGPGIDGQTVVAGRTDDGGDVGEGRDDAGKSKPAKLLDYDAKIKNLGVLYQLA